MSKHGPVLARSEPQNDETGLERLIFFSDAVFAIAITLLALEIRLPPLPDEATNAELRAALLSIWPKYLSYVISFATIGTYWAAHHRTFRNIRRYDGRLIFLNLLTLLFVGFIPFPTSVLGEYGNRVATIFYAATMAAVGLTQSLVWIYAKSGGRLLDQPLPTAQYRRLLARNLLAPCVFLLSIPIAFWNDDLAKYSWTLIALRFYFDRISPE